MLSSAESAGTNLLSFGSGVKLLTSCEEQILTNPPQGADKTIQVQRGLLTQDLEGGVSASVNLQLTLGRLFGWVLMFGTY